MSENGTETGPERPKSYFENDLKIMVANIGGGLEVSVLQDGKRSYTVSVPRDKAEPLKWFVEQRGYDCIADDANTDSEKGSVKHAKFRIILKD